MPYAALMVHLDVERNSDKRLNLAIDLADRLHAALIGVCGWAPRPAFLAEGVVIDPEPTERERQEMAARLDEIGNQFRAAAKQIRHVEWRGGLDFPTELVVRAARAADLIILGRDPAPGDVYHSLDPAGTLLRAGRPVLLVPAPVDALGLRRAIVAWKDTREARRAIKDALPLLREAKDVMVVEVCREGEESEAQQHIDDVTRYLVRHKVIVGAKAYLHTQGSVAGELLRFAKDESADLLVAGGYGHSRMGEWIFGGVTSELMATSPTCCLLSH